MREKLGLGVACLFAVGWIVFLAGSVYRGFLAPSRLDTSPTTAIGNPRMAEPAISASAATHLDDEELVIGTIAAGRPRAYPIGYLQLSEHMNDVVQGFPVLATGDR